MISNIDYSARLTKETSVDYTARPCTKETSFDYIPRPTKETCCEYTTRPSTRDNITQCTCNCYDNKNPCKLTETQSPLVVISVYPNSDIECDSVTVSKNVETSLRDCTHLGYSKVQARSTSRQAPNLDKATKGTLIGTALRDTVLQQDLGRNKAYIHKTYRMPSRSPTPQNVKNMNLKDQNKVIETRMVRTNASGQSPSKSPHTKIPVRTNASRTIKKQESKKTIASKQKHTSTRNMQMSKNKCKSRSKDKCGSGNQTKSKLFVADKYKRAINERVDKYNNTSPKHEVSAVSINIESENECYDVSFQQGQYTTDVIVHKTSKICDKLNDSTVNFFPGSRKPIFTNEFQTYSVSISGTDNVSFNMHHFVILHTKTLLK